MNVVGLCVSALSPRYLASWALRAKAADVESSDIDAESWGFTLPETHIAPARKPSEKEVVFQPPIFREGE